MAHLVEKPVIIAAAGNKPKQIEEFVGRVASNTTDASIARMTSPPGWVEPPQKPEFNEYTVVLEGMLRVETAGGTFDVHAGQAIIVLAGERVRYSTPDVGGAQYIAVCLPAFSAENVHREDK